MELIHSKSLLAKLMATENLIVEHRNVPTASFDVKNRILTIPVLDKNISGHLYDLFVGHEVGHALYTPEDGMKKAREKKLSMSVMNVLEDVRIEKKIKNKYPGIRTSFVRGYKELLDKDFFEISGIDLNDINFIDRVNIFSKGGPAQGIIFSEKERDILNAIENTETYDDVIEIAERVMAYLKEEKEEKEKANPTAIEDEPEEEFDDTGYNDADDFTEEDEEFFGNDTDYSDLQPEKSDEEEQEENSDSHGTPDFDEAEEDNGEKDDIKSHTDESFKRNEKKLFEDSGREYYYGNIPDLDLDSVIVKHKELWTRYRTWMSDNEISSGGVDVESFIKLRNDAKKVVGYLSKEFELRKNADQLKRASVAKTGDLNMSKIFSYKFNEDIFKKITVLPGGKSHGLVMFLDWSGSMNNHMENTIKQLINLVMFCKKVNIPYEVYAFTSEYDNLHRNDFVENDIDMHGFKLLNLISSKMSAIEFTYACSALTRLSRGRSARPTWMSLGGTPLSESIIAAMKVVPEFQKAYKLQVVNTVFLTDGEGGNLNRVMFTCEGRRTTGMPGIINSYKSQKHFVIRDPLTKNEEVVENVYGRHLTSAYIKLLKARTNCNIVGFYVLSGREFGREAYNFFSSAADHQKLKSEFRKDKFKIVTSAGYDEYYLLRSEGLDTDDDVEFEVKENATTRGLVSAFSKYAGNRLSNRVVLNRFIGMIA
jgi:hypothetical protein